MPFLPRMFDPTSSRSRCTALRMRELMPFGLAISTARSTGFRTMLGATPEQAAHTVEDCGADVNAANAGWPSIDAPAAFIVGCCGTMPDLIRTLAGQVC